MKSQGMTKVSTLHAVGDTNVYKMVIHPIFVQIFQSGPKWWPDQSVNIVISTKMLPLITVEFKLLLYNFSPNIKTPLSYSNPFTKTLRDMLVKSWHEDHFYHLRGYFWLHRSVTCFFLLLLQLWSSDSQTILTSKEARTHSYFSFLFSLISHDSHFYNCHRKNQLPWEQHRMCKSALLLWGIKCVEQSHQCFSFTIIDHWQQRHKNKIQLNHMRFKLPSAVAVCTLHCVFSSQTSTAIYQLPLRSDLGG